MPDDVKQLLKEIHCLNLIGDWDNEDAQTLINRGAELYKIYFLNCKNTKENCEVDE